MASACGGRSVCRRGNHLEAGRRDRGVPQHRGVAFYASRRVCAEAHHGGRTVRDGTPAGQGDLPPPRRGKRPGERRADPLSGLAARFSELPDQGPDGLRRAIRDAVRRGEGGPGDIRAGALDTAQSDPQFRAERRWHHQPIDRAGTAAGGKYRRRRIFQAPGLHRAGHHESPARTARKLVRFRRDVKRRCPERGPAGPRTRGQWKARCGPV